jgi:amidase
MTIVDTAGALCPHGFFELAPSGDGPLNDLTFAAKDLIDVDGRVTGAGNPHWLETHLPAGRTAPCITALLRAGARMAGKTITDELAYSLNGDNIHYRTPKNTKAPNRVPGGSSSGSASAVAAGLCDFALGTDSGGSVRIPASYCGIYGIRTILGAASMEGVVPFMPSFDTVGWFAHNVHILAAVGEVLLPPTTGERYGLPKRLIVATDALSVVDADALLVVQRGIDMLLAAFEDVGQVAIAPEGLERWRETYRTVSAHEAWQINAEWIEAHGSGLSSPIAERFAYAKTVSDGAAAAARQHQSRIRQRMHALLGSDAVLCIPSAPGIAPKLQATGDEVEAFRKGLQRLTSVASLAGLPQVSLPGLEVDGAPVGLSLVGAAGSDRFLLKLAGRIWLERHPLTSDRMALQS